VSPLDCAGEEAPLDEAAETGVEKFNFVPCGGAPDSLNAGIPDAVDGGVPLVVEVDELPEAAAGLNEKLADDAGAEAALLAPALANEKLGAPELWPTFENENAGALLADTEELEEPKAGRGGCACGVRHKTGSYVIDVAGLSFCLPMFC